MHFNSRFIRNSFLCCLLALTAFLISCNNEDPEPGEEGKTITNVTLLFSPVAGGAPISISATDPNNEGPEGLMPEPIVLPSDKSFQLFIRIRNDIESQDLTELIADEGNDHLFFFGFSDAIFGQPEGDGNIDNSIFRMDQVNYIDEDENGLPIGLITGWQTGDPGSGVFRIMLKNQQDMKTETSGSDVGITDFDITFPVTIE